MLKFVEQATLKRYTMYGFIVALIIVALFAVISILLWTFWDIQKHVFMTLLVILVHLFLTLSFVANDQHKTLYGNFLFFEKLFFHAYFKFFTSIFWIWNIIEWANISKLYGTYAIITFGSLHAEILSRVLGINKNMNYTIYANYIFILLVVLFLQVWIYDLFTFIWDFRFRLIAAMAIIDATLTIVILAFYKMYLYKNPTVNNVLNSGNEKRQVLVYGYGFS